MLKHLNLLCGELPTNVAVLLFGKAPQRFLISPRSNSLTSTAPRFPSDPFLSGQQGNRLRPGRSSGELRAEQGCAVGRYPGRRRPGACEVRDSEGGRDRYLPRAHRVGRLAAGLGRPRGIDVLPGGLRRLNRPNLPRCLPALTACFFASVWRCSGAAARELPTSAPTLRCARRHALLRQTGGTARSPLPQYTPQAVRRCCSDAAGAPLRQSGSMVPPSLPPARTPTRRITDPSTCRGKSRLPAQSGGRTVAAVVAIVRPASIRVRARKRMRPSLAGIRRSALETELVQRVLRHVSKELDVPTPA